MWNIVRIPRNPRLSVDTFRSSRRPPTASPSLPLQQPLRLHPPLLLPRAILPPRAPQDGSTCRQRRRVLSSRRRRARPKRTTLPQQPLQLLQPLLLQQPALMPRPVKRKRRKISKHNSNRVFILSTYYSVKYSSYSIPVVFLCLRLPCLFLSRLSAFVGESDETKRTITTTGSQLSARYKTKS